MSELLSFSKYQGLGNDFVLVDGRQAELGLEAAEVRRICERRLGVGADGILELRRPEDPAALVQMVVHNADGSVAENCGNGLRCVVRHLVRTGEAPPEGEIVIETGAGPVRARLEGEEVEVEMGAARSDAASLQLTGPLGESPDDDPDEPLLQVSLKLKDRKVEGTGVSLGNPHLVLFDASREQAEALGQEISTHERFAAGVNAGFAHLAADGGIDLTVWERGAGLTLACGTGACAAVAAAVATRRRPSGRWIEVRLPGGPLKVKAAEDLSQIWMRGPAVHVFDGRLERVAPADGEDEA
ncbi:MAG: diaminopimelate epimerase [Deltaproteobacteria bacterium]|nr:diaminopimelate epimerase [Deltaproteobacteria bacterium]